MQRGGQLISMARARNHSRGNNYFPCDVDILWSKKGSQAQTHGPLGISVWIALLSKIYDNDDYGYYIKVNLDDLAFDLIDDIKVVPNGVIPLKMREVILHCADIGLLDKDLVRQGVITSYSIQEQYASMIKASKRKLIIENYWVAPIPLKHKNIKSSEDSALSYVDSKQSYVDSHYKIK